jgi:general secretion pathway protein G
MNRGFTLVELLMVIAVVGILAGIVLTNVSIARERAQIAKTALEVKEVAKILFKYHGDTGGYPPTCDNVCTAANDPFLVNPGVAGWDGPYGVLHNKAHPWGGHFGIAGGYDIDGGGNDYIIFLNDDRPGFPDADNGGQIPLNALLMLDTILDDGVLTTGTMRGNGDGNTAQGEAMIKVIQ